MDTQTALVPVQKPNDDDKLISMWLATGKRQSEHTQAAYTRYAYALLKHAGRPFQELTLADVLAYLETVTGSDSTKALATNTLKSLFSFATTFGYIQVNLGSALTALRPRDELAQRILSEEDTIRMVTLETNPRNHAILRLLYHAGLRVSEVVGLTWGDVRETPTGAVLDVFGKGRKLRHVPISKSMHDELRGLDGAHLGKDRYVFQSRKGKGGVLSMDTRQVERIVLDAAKRAGIDGNVSPHWLRHSHVSHAIDNGADITVVGTSVGHTSLDTTMRYRHLNPALGSSQHIKL
jgi:integrase/recombinase XerD